MSNTNSVLAPVSGTILSIEIEAGQKVQAGDTLAIIESMKMEIPVEAETDGVIADINIEVSALVEEDQPLFTMTR